MEASKKELEKLKKGKYYLYSKELIVERPIGKFENFTEHPGNIHVNFNNNGEKIYILVKNANNVFVNDTLFDPTNNKNILFTQVPEKEYDLERNYIEHPFTTDNFNNNYKHPLGIPYSNDLMLGGKSIRRKRKKRNHTKKEKKRRMPFFV